MTPPPYPRIPHLVPGRGTRDDLVLGPAERTAMLGTTLEAEEKVDGANVMCWVEDGVVRSSGRSGPDGGDRAGQFGALRAWMAEHSDRLRAVLAPGDVLYGEWLMLTHTLAYTALPELFVALDLVRAGVPVAHGERREVLTAAGFTVPPLVGRRLWNLDALEAATARTAWGDGPAEGVVVRVVDPDHRGPTIAKLVRADFRPIPDAAWRAGRPLNRLADRGGAAR